MKTGWKQGEFILDQVFWFGMTAIKCQISYFAWLSFSLHMQGKPAQTWIKSKSGS